MGGDLFLSFKPRTHATQCPLGTMNLRMSFFGFLLKTIPKKLPSKNAAFQKCTTKEDQSHVTVLEVAAGQRTECLRLQFPKDRPTNGS